MSDAHHTPDRLPAPIVTPRRFEPGDVIVLNAGTALERKLRFVESGDTGHTFEDVDRPKEFEHFSHVRMAEVAATEGYRHHRGERTLRVVETKTRTGVTRLDQLPAKDAQRASRRYHYVRGFLRLKATGEATKSGKSIDKALKQLENEFADQGIDAGKKPSLSAFRRWLKAFEATYNVVELRAYYVHRWGPQQRDPAVDKALDEHVQKYLVTHRAKKKHEFASLRDGIDLLNVERQASGQALLKPPGYKTFDARINARGQFAIEASRTSIEEARRRWVMITGGTETLLPGERWEIDAWEIPLQVIFERNGIYEILSPKQIKVLKASRWIACAIKDVATKIMLGLHIGQSENTDVVLATFEMATTDKKPYSDAAGAQTPWNQHCGALGGWGDMSGPNTSNRAHYAFSVCGYDIAHPPAKHPWLRGAIEAAFMADHVGLFTRFAGRTFENPVAKGGYDSEALASLLFQEFCTVYVRYYVDIYHNTPQPGLFGETPVNRWNRLVPMYGIVEPPDREKRRLAFGIKLTRALDNRGVRILNLHYNSVALHKHLCRIGFQETVSIKLSRHDMGAAAVEIGDGDWITVPCVQPGMTDVTVAEWMATTSDLRDRFGAEAKISDAVRLEAIRDLRKLSEAAMLRANIGSPLVKPEQIDLAEESLRFGFCEQSQTDDHPNDDLLGNLIPAATPPDPEFRAAAAAMPTRPAPDAPSPAAPDEERKPSWEDPERIFKMDD